MFLNRLTHTSFYTLRNKETQCVEKKDKFKKNIITVIFFFFYLKKKSMESKEMWYINLHTTLQSGFLKIRT